MRRWERLRRAVFTHRVANAEALKSRWTFPSLVSEKRSRVKRSLQNDLKSSLHLAKIVLVHSRRFVFEMEILDESSSGARLLTKSWRFGVDSPDLEATLSCAEGDLPSF